MRLNIERGNERGSAPNIITPVSLELLVQSIVTDCPFPPESIVNYLNQQRQNFDRQSEKTEKPFQMEKCTFVKGYSGAEFQQFSALTAKGPYFYQIVTVPVDILKPGQIGVLALPSIFTVSLETKRKQIAQTVDKLMEIIFSKGLSSEIDGVKWPDPDKIRLALQLNKLEWSAMNGPVFLELLGQYCPEEIGKYAWLPKQTDTYFFCLMQDGRISVYDSSGVSPSLPIKPLKPFVTTDLFSVKSLPSNQFWINIPPKQFLKEEFTPALLKFIQQGRIDIYQPNIPFHKSLTEFLCR